MRRRQTRSTRTHTLFPYTTHFRSSVDDPKSTLRTRMWYPLSATTQRIQAAADLWSNVSQNHDEHADPKDVSLGSARSEEHTSELKSLMSTTYAVFCSKKKTDRTNDRTQDTNDN